MQAPVCGRSPETQRGEISRNSLGLGERLAWSDLGLLLPLTFRAIRSKRRSVLMAFSCGASNRNLNNGAFIGIDREQRRLSEYVSSADRRGEKTAHQAMRLKQTRMF